MFHVDANGGSTQQLVTPTKFEDLIGQPKINVKSESGASTRRKKKKKNKSRPTPFSKLINADSGGSGGVSASTTRRVPITNFISHVR